MVKTLRTKEKKCTAHIDKGHAWSAWDRKWKFYVVPSSPDRQEKALVILILLSQGQLLHSCLSHCVSLELGLATSGWGPQKYGWTAMWDAFHLWLDITRQKCGLQFMQLRSYHLLPVLKGNCLSLLFFWWSLGVALDLGRAVTFVPSLGTIRVSLGSFNTARNIHFLSQLKLDKIFKIFLLRYNWKLTLVSCVWNNLWYLYIWQNDHHNKSS